MSMLSRRLQILLDEARYRRIESEAKRRHVSVATIVREALDRAYPTDADTRRRAVESILAADPMPVPTVGELRKEIADAHDRFS